MTARRATLLIATLLALIAIAPALAFVLGLALNAAWGCDIRDEGGYVHGDCAAWQSDIAYPLMMTPWMLLVTLPFAGIPAMIAFAVTFILYMVRWSRGKNG